MSVVKRLKGVRAEQPRGRYAIVADGGRDPGGQGLPSAERSVNTEWSDDTELLVSAERSVKVPDAGAPDVGEGRAAARAAAPALQISAEVDEIPAGHGLEELDPGELEHRREALEELIAMMRPAVQMDGGDLALVDVDYDAGVIEVELQGACGSCAISATTLQGGVERLLKERLEWVTEVHGGIDDSVDPLESAAMGRGAYVPRYY